MKILCGNASWLREETCLCNLLSDGHLTGNQALKFELTHIRMFFPPFVALLTHNSHIFEGISQQEIEYS